MKSPLHSGVMRVRQATACAVIVACLLPLPTSAQTQSADKGTPVAVPAVLSNPIQPVAMPGSADGRDTSAGGFWVGRQAAEQWSGPTTGPIARSLANLHDQTIAPAGWKVTRESQGYRGPRGRGRRSDRAVVGIVLGALGGLVAGGVIGSELSTTDSCHCSDPQLHGFLIGGSIGAVVGAFLGYAVAR